ncbi:GD24477 [Drosophila simulans]|uniref:GD24477 n=1 Tax=Drosophila simulans TaxID=7240 RepID=B4NUM3_DROSI|nr:GD24477 [Drosophila simulans]
MPSQEPQNNGSADQDLRREEQEQQQKVAVLEVVVQCCSGGDQDGERSAIGLPRWRCLRLPTAVAFA